MLEDLEEKECNDEEEEEERIKMAQFGQFGLYGRLRITECEKHVFHYIIIPQPKTDTDGREMKEHDEMMSGCRIKAQCFR